MPDPSNEIETMQPENTSSEKTRSFNSAWLFDVDGTLTEPEAKKIEAPEIIEELIRRLKLGGIIGLNTGRSLDFISTEVLDPLEERIQDKSLLQNVIAIGEKGAVVITYDETGSRKEQIDENIRVPEDLQEEIRQLVSQPPFSETIFFDDTKRTMISVELRKNIKIEDFKELQNQLNKVLSELLKRHNLADEFKIDPSRIATDIENKQVGKALGVRKFVGLLEERGIEPEEYVSFGDSSADLEMFKELKRLGKKVDFIFVGGKEHLPGEGLEQVIFTDKLCDKGTLEYLKTEVIVEK